MATKIAVLSDTHGLLRLEVLDSIGCNALVVELPDFFWSGLLPFFHAYLCVAGFGGYVSDTISL